MMMRFKFSLFLVCTAQFIIGQSSTEMAFSKSYSFEYESQYAKAIKPLLELKVDNYEVDLRLGWLYYLSKDYTNSEMYYKKAIKLEPNSIEARFGVVLPVSAIGNWNSVLATYYEIVKIDPNNSTANYRIGNIFYSRKEYPNAASYLLRVLKMYPFDFDSNLLMGKVLIAQEKPAEAKKYILKALEYYPQSDEAKALMKKL